VTFLPYAAVQSVVNMNSVAFVQQSYFCYIFCVQLYIIMFRYHLSAVYTVSVTVVYCYLDFPGGPVLANSIQFSSATSSRSAKGIFRPYAQPTLSKH